jgi:hypothetical protein
MCILTGVVKKSFSPTNSPLNHWLVRLPPTTTSLPPTKTIFLDTNHNDHRALTASIPQIGYSNPQTPSSTTNISITRDNLPSPPTPKPHKDFYHQGDEATRQAQHEASITLHQLLTSDDSITAHIDKAAKLILNAIDKYHLLTQRLWPMTHISIMTDNKKNPPSCYIIVKKKIQRITHLRNSPNTIKSK